MCPTRLLERLHTGTEDIRLQLLAELKAFSCAHRSSRQALTTVERHARGMWDEKTAALNKQEEAKPQTRHSRKISAAP